MLLDRRVAFKPFEYPELEDMWLKIQKTYWIHNSIEFSADVQHFKIELNDKERYIIGTILKSFTQTEVSVFEDFWSKIGSYFPKPEIGILGATFSENECRHSIAYSRLNDVLGLQDFDAFLQDPILIERFDNLSKVEPKNGIYDPEEILQTLALFGCFTEYVNLFSQFAILKSFSANGRNLLPNIGTIIDYSALDENVHALSAIYLANKLKEEYPYIWNDKIKSKIMEAARTTFELEINLINQIFEHGDLVNLRKSELINFMKNRINEALTMIGLPILFNDINKTELSNMSWFLDNLFAKQQSDFFYRKPTAYTKFNKPYTKETVFLTKEEIEKI